MPLPQNWKKVLILKILKVSQDNDDRNDAISRQIQKLVGRQLVYSAIHVWFATLPVTLSDILAQSSSLQVEHKASTLRQCMPLKVLLGVFAYHWNGELALSWPQSSIKGTGLHEAWSPCRQNSVRLSPRLSINTSKVVRSTTVTHLQRV